MNRTLGSMVVAVLLLLLTGGVAVAQEGPGNVVRCDGGRCEGTDARDILLSSDKPEEVIGKAGGDDDIELDATIAGGTNDLAFGDLGRDCIDGGAGDDGMIGDDTLAARDGDCDDFLDGGPGRDDCSADPGDVVSNCENGESQPGDQGGSAPPQSGAEPNRAPDPMSFTTLFGSTRTTTALRGGLITVPGMAVNCGVGPCMVDERLLAAERKRVEGSARAGGKRRGLVGRDRDVVAGGKTHEVRVRLSEAANRRLRRRGRIRLQVVVTVTDAKGRAQRVDKRITVKPAR